MTADLVLTPSPSVSEAIETRRSIREFEERAVSEADVREIVEAARRSASGGNLQPWHLHVLAGDALEALLDRVAEKSKETPFGDGPEYAIYPADLSEPYRARRGKVAEGMYELLGIARDDVAGRGAAMAKNFRFFGAPVGMLLTIDKQMGPPQFCDLGIFLGNLMLLAREKGLHSCPQEAWSLWGGTIREVLGLPESELVFCGLALGYAREDSAINGLWTERAALDDVARFSGF
ncbi:MAG: nitroreductase [Myxococcota bacterium]|jgi:nitroreductase|nr:nitroreductase [Myxococcota bacterium]